MLKKGMVSMFDKEITPVDGNESPQDILSHKHCNI